MAAVSNALRRILRVPDPRSPREVDDDIVAELEFHLAEAADELVASGLTPDAARARARERFGDFERTRSACRRAQLGDRIMLVRVQWVVIALLVVALFVVGVQSVRARQMAQEQLLAAQAAAEEARAAQMRASDEALEREASLDELAQVARQIRDGKGTLGRLASAERSEVPADPAQQQHERAKEWLARFLENEGSWRHGLDLAYQLAQSLPPDEAAAILGEIYPHLPVSHREQLLKPFVFDGGSPCALKVLDLGANDAEASVRERAYVYLRNYAFVDFSEDPDAYSAWYAKFGQMPLKDAITQCAEAMVSRLRFASSDPSSFERQMRLLRDVDFAAARKAMVDLRSVLGSAGLLELSQSWIGSDDPDRMAFGLRAAGWMELDRAALESQVIPLLAEHGDHRPQEVWDEFCRLVGRSGNGWAIEHVVRVAALRIRDDRGESSQFATAQALADIRDPRAIPQMIGLLAADDSRDPRYAFGYYGLRELTGVAWDESHDAQWWREWWEKNSHRFGEAAALPIPTFQSGK